MKNMFKAGDVLHLSNCYIGHPAFFIEDLQVWKFVFKEVTNRSVVIFFDYALTELDDFYGSDACFFPDERTHCLVLLGSSIVVCSIKDLQVLEQ